MLSNCYGSGPPPLPPLAPVICGTSGQNGFERCRTG